MSFILAIHIVDNTAYSSPVGTFIQEQCRVVRGRLLRRSITRTSIPPVVPVIQEKLEWARKREASLGTDSRKAALQEWKERWRATRPRNRWRSSASQAEPSASRLKLHSQLKKAESSILVQARTGRIGLAHFLAKARVPGYESPTCRCGAEQETAEHTLLHCEIERERRKWPRGARFSDLVSIPRNTPIVTRWLIQCNRINQFQLANRLLYNEATS
jgi:hypothetical protein